MAWLAVSRPPPCTQTAAGDVLLLHIACSRATLTITPPGPGPPPACPRPPPSPPRARPLLRPPPSLPHLCKVLLPLISPVTPSIGAPLPHCPLLLIRSAPRLRLHASPLCYPWPPLLTPTRLPLNVSVLTVHLRACQSLLLRAPPTPGLCSSTTLLRATSPQPRSRRARPRVSSLSASVSNETVAPATTGKTEWDNLCSFLFISIQNMIFLVLIY